MYDNKFKNVIYINKNKEIHMTLIQIVQLILISIKIIVLHKCQIVICFNR